MPILVANQDGRPVTAAQVARLFAILKGAGLERDDLDDLMEQLGCPAHPDELTRTQYDEVVQAIESLAEEAA